MITNIVKLNKELSVLKLSNDETIKAKTALETEITELKSKLSKLEEDQDIMVKKVESAKADEAATIVAIEESVNKKVVQSLSAIGVVEGLVKEDTAVPVASSSEVYNKFESLTGRDKIEFFKKNEKDILNQMKSIHYTNNPLVSAMKISNHNHQK